MQERNDKAGVLWVVATPIGNLADIGERAREVLSNVELVIAEDTRHSGRLLRHLGIDARMTSLHEHNESARAGELVERLAGGLRAALLSDAGTPLISDPGYRLVRGCRERGVTVSPVPGPCAAVAALSVAGLPSDRFVFEGFPPAKSQARRRYFEGLGEEPRTLIFYESAHRIAACLSDLATVLGAEREACVAREMTKLHETLYRGSLGELAERLDEAGEQRGELVLVVAGAGYRGGDAVGANARRILPLLLAELPASRAVKLTASITGAKRNALYALARELASDEDEPGPE